MKLLVVDDSSMVRNRIARIVDQRRLPVDLVVALARDGNEAVQLAKAVRPELVTMDLTMPGMDGLACIPELLSRQPHMRILVVSALNDKSTAIEALRLGARGFLHKPFSDDELLLALLELVEP